MKSTSEYLYVEVWNAKPEWLGLAQDERQQFMSRVDDWLNTVIQPGSREVYGTCVNDGDTTPRAPYTYVVVWKLKDRSHVKAIADGTASVGWYQYFDQANLGGDKLTADELVDRIMAL